MDTLEEHNLPNQPTPLPLDSADLTEGGQFTTKGDTRSERRQIVERLLAERQVRLAGMANKDAVVAV